MAMQAKTTLQLVNDKKSDFQARWDRMDATRRRIYLEKYTLLGADGQYKNKAIPGVISVTMNSAAVFANTVVSALMAGQWQTVIEGKVPGNRTHRAEEFIDNVLAEADERLVARGQPPLFQWLCNHVAVRGFIGCRFLWLKDGAAVYPDCLPLDMRYVVYEVNTNGLLWAANLTRRSAADILNEYGVTLRPGAATAEVADYWDGEKEEVWIDRSLAKTIKHRLGQVPFVICGVPTGFMLRDEGYFEHESPDILFLNESLYDEENRSVSIEQTLNMKLILPPYQKPSGDMGGQPAPYPDGVGKVTEVLQGEEYQLLQTKDVNLAHQMGTGHIQKALGQGGLSDIDLGSWMSNPPPSGAAITAQGEIRAKVLNPRLEALASFKGALARLIISQYTARRLKATVGLAGRRLGFTAAELGDPSQYRISYRLMSRSKVQEVANLAMAQAAQGIYSTMSIHKNILMSDDPEGEVARLEAERTEQADPALFFLRKAFACVDEAAQLTGEEKDEKLLESQMLTRQCVRIIHSRRQPASVPQPPPGQTAGAKPSGSLVPLLGQKGLSAAAPQEAR
jgi:hypothetical protein